ncbi:MAG TPA: hypothetical protein QGH28_04895 [Chloroflexota bacterium]|nr:hypothetical protein [Chloroflexota bacterium]
MADVRTAMVESDIAGPRVKGSIATEQVDAASIEITCDRASTTESFVFDIDGDLDVRLEFVTTGTGLYMHGEAGGNSPGWVGAVEDDVSGPQISSMGNPAGFLLQPGIFDTTNWTYIDEAACGGGRCHHVQALADVTLDLYLTNPGYVPVKIVMTAEQANPPEVTLEVTGWDKEFDITVPEDAVELLPEELSLVMADYFQAISASLGQ